MREGKRGHAHRGVWSEFASPGEERLVCRGLASVDCDAESQDPRYAPAYLLGSLTVRLRRPFLRRRLSTARPHLVSMRARNPCVLMRRLFRGRYVGLPMDYSKKTCEGKCGTVGET